MTKEAKHPVRTLETSIELLTLLQQQNGAGVTELSEQVDKSKSAVHNHLSTLEEHGFVANEAGEYRLGLRFLEFGGYTRQCFKVYRQAKPHLKELAKRTGGRAGLIIEENGHGVFVYGEQGEHGISHDNFVGKHFDLHTTAAGKALLAHLPSEQVHSIVETHGLQAHTENTITDKDSLIKELERIRERDYAIDDEERFEGLRCVGAPIKEEENGKAIAGISVSGPSTWLTNDRLEQSISEEVLSTKNRIELDFWYS